MFKSRFLKVMMALFAIVAAIFALQYYTTYDERRIEAELRRSATSGQTSDVFAENDLICFNDNNGTERSDFARAAKRVGRDISKSIEACGVDRSCCEVASNVNGVVGIVRGDEIKCLAIWRFVYLLEKGREACIQPSRLRVSIETFETEIGFQGRPWKGMPGTSYFK